MAPQETLRLVALQIEPSANLSDTLLQIQSLLANVCAQYDSVDCVVLPEYAFGTFREWASTKQDSTHLTKQIQSSISSYAQQYKVAIVAGSIPYETEPHQWRNRSFVISSEGQIVGSYDKQHPFRVEKRLGLEPGSDLPTFKIRNLTMGVLICSDLWYHDTVSKLASQIDFLAVPTMTTVLNCQQIKYGQWVWQSLVAVRSKEYTMPIISADQASREYAPGIFTCGGSCIADPSARFSNAQGPHTQALRIATNEKPHSIISQISIQAVRDYADYRREVGLRK